MGPALESALNDRRRGWWDATGPCRALRDYYSGTERLLGYCCLTKHSWGRVLTPVNTQGIGEELTRGLDLTSEFVIRTGDATTAITLRGLESLVIAEMVFIGRQEALTDAKITLGIYNIANAAIRHSEFYGLSTLVTGGAVVHAYGSRLTIDRTVFLGCTGNSGVRTPVVLNTTWIGGSVTESIFADYGQRPNYFGKLHLAAPFSWIMVGNTAALSNLSPEEKRRSATCFSMRVGSLASRLRHLGRQCSRAVILCPTVSGIASSRCDFTSAVGTLRFAAGESSKTFVVLISQDNYVEGPEALT